jgi:hypothetical protein
MTNNRATELDRQAFQNFRADGNAGAICVKKYPTGDEKAGFMGYSAFGVLVNVGDPFTVYLRGDDPADDFKTTKVYDTLDAMFDDGWVVD